MMYWYLLLSLGIVVLLIYISPLFYPKRNTLPVLLFSKIGKPFATSKDTGAWLAPARLERLFQYFKKQNFRTLLPQEISPATHPAKAVLLCFTGGYQSFYTHVFPLLEKYDLHATVCLPVALLGKYDAWEAQGPWQPLLTLEQLHILHKSGRVAFAVQGLDGTLSQDPIWSYQEAKHRLETIYHLPASAAFIPQDLKESEVPLSLVKLYPFLITPKKMQQASSFQSTLVLAVRRYTSLLRLMWKLNRSN